MVWGFRVKLDKDIIIWANYMTFIKYPKYLTFRNADLTLYCKGL